MTIHKGRGVSRSKGSLVAEFLRWDLTFNASFHSMRVHDVCKVILPMGPVVGAICDRKILKSLYNGFDYKHVLTALMYRNEG